MKKLAKILAVVLSLALLVCGIVIVASAEGEVASATKADGTDAGVHTTVAEAITAAGEGGTVTLLADVTEAITVANDLTLDLNGKTLTATKQYTVTVNAGKVTVKNGNIVNTSASNGTGALYRKGDAQLSVIGCNVEAGYYGIYVDATPSEALESGYHFDMQDCTVEAGADLLYIKGNTNYTAELYGFSEDVNQSLFNVFQDVDGDGLSDTLFWHDVEAVSENPYGVQYVGSDGNKYTDVASIPEGVTYTTQELFLAFYRTKINVKDSSLICALDKVSGRIVTGNYLEIANKVNNPSYNHYRTNGTDVAITDCYVETDYDGYYAYSGAIDIDNTLTVFRGTIDLYKESGSASTTGIFSNGRVSVSNSAFIHPNYKAINNSSYFRFANSGSNIGSANYIFGDNVYFSSATNWTGKKIQDKLVALDVYGAQGYIYNTKGEAELPTCFATVSEKFGIDIELPKATGNNYYEDFENSKVTHTPATEDTAGREGWVVRGVELAGQGIPTAKGGYYELDTTTAGAYTKLFTDTAIYLGQYNTEMELQEVLGYGTYAGIDGVNSGYIAFDDIGLYTVDFDLKSDVDVALFLGTVDEELADAYTGSVTVAKTNNKWTHITLVTKVVDGLTITNVYVNGELVGAANFNTSAAVGIKGIGIKMSAGDDAGTVAIDNVSIETQAADYTAADVLFERGTNAPLTAWADAYAEAQIGEEKYVKLEDAIAAAAEGETLTLLRTLSYTVKINNAVVINTNGNELTYELKAGYVAAADGDIITVTSTATKVKWYLDKNKETFVEASYAAGEEIVLPEDAEVVGEYETYLNDAGEAVDVPYAYDENGELYYKTALTGASDLEKWVWNGEWTVTENEDGSLEYAPVYVGGIASITAEDGTVTYYEKFLAFETAFEGNAGKGATAKLMSDIAIPRLRDKSLSDNNARSLFNIGSGTRSFDLNGHSLYCEVAKFTGSSLWYGTVRVFNVGNGANFSLYSSQPGGEIYTASTVFYTTGANTINIGRYEDAATGEVYSGDNLSIYTAYLVHRDSNINSSEINVDGGLYVRKQDGQALVEFSREVKNGDLYAYSNNVSFKNATIAINHGAVIRVGNNASTAWPTVPAAENYNSFSFENCTFIGLRNEGSNSTRNFAHELDYTNVSIQNCYFESMKLGTTQPAISTSYTTTLNNLIFSDDDFLVTSTDGAFATADDFTAARIDAYTKEYTGLKACHYTNLTYTYDVTVDGTTTTYTKESIKPIKVLQWNDAIINATVVYTTDTPVEVSFTAGEVTVTEQWAQGSTPIIPDEVAAAAEAMGLAGYYSYKFDTPEVATENTAYEAAFVLDIKLNLVLHSSFTYNVYLPIDESEAPTLIFSSIQLGDSVYDFENGTTTTINGVRYYVVSFEDVDPSNAAAATALTVTGTVGGTDFTVEKNISVVDYATLLAGLNISEQSNDIAKAILAYVKAAYVYFGNTAAEEYAKAEAAANANPINVTATTEGANTDLSSMSSFIYSACLNLEGAPKLRFYLKDGVYPSTAANAVKFEYYYNGKLVTVDTYTNAEEILGNDNGRYYVELELRAYELAQDIRITCGEASGYYNLATYYAGSNQYDVKLMDLVEALATYANAAKAYNDSIN